MYSCSSFYHSIAQKQPNLKALIAIHLPSDMLISDRVPYKIKLQPRTEGLIPPHLMRDGKKIYPND